AREAGARCLDLDILRLAPRAVEGPLRWHTAQEQLILVLAGHPALRRVCEGVEDRVALQPGDLVSWRTGPASAHQLLGGDDEASLLVVRARHDGDVVVYPELGRVEVAALARAGALTPA